MYADHFSLEVNDGDRVILCSDGLSSMISDSEIESLAVSSATPQQAADNLVAAALTAGGSDNVTVIVVDVLNDGLADAARRRLVHRAAGVSGVIVAALAMVLLVSFAFIRSEWYLGIHDGTVAIYRGIQGDVFGIPLNELVETSAVSVTDLPASVQDQLSSGIRVQNEDAAVATINSYHEQINREQERAAQIADEVRSEDATATQAPEAGADDAQNGGE